MLVFGFALMAAYWPNIGGAATTPRWDVAALLAIPLFLAPRIQWRPAHVLGALLLGLLAISLLWSEGRQDGIDAAFKLSLAAIAFAVGGILSDLKPLTIGAALGILPSSIAAIAQAYGWHGLPMDIHPGGLFYNSDRLAAAAAVVAIAALALRQWIIIPATIPAVILPESRAALIALAVGGTFALWRFCSAWSRIAVGIIAAATAFLILVIRGIDAGITQRIDLWQDTLSALTWSGHGLGSFWSSFPAHAYHFDFAQTATRPDHPHSEWLWVAYEGGALGFVLAVAFAVSCWFGGRGPLRAVLCFLFALSIVAMPFHDPATLIFGALVAGHLVSRRGDVRNVVNICGIPLRPRLAAA